MSIHCTTCPDCQLTQLKGPKEGGGKLQPMSIVSISFERIGMDLVGSQTTSTGKHCFILVVIDYVIHYPEAINLRTAWIGHLVYRSRLLKANCYRSRDGVHGEGLEGFGQGMHCFGGLGGVLLVACWLIVLFQNTLGCRPFILQTITCNSMGWWKGSTVTSRVCYANLYTKEAEVGANGCLSYCLPCERFLRPP